MYVRNDDDDSIHDQVDRIEAIASIFARGVLRARKRFGLDLTAPDRSSESSRTCLDVDEVAGPDRQKAVG